MSDTDANQQLRSLPKVDRVLERPASQRLLRSQPRWAVVEAIRNAIIEARASILDGQTPDLDGVLDRRIAALTTLALEPSLVDVINATGIVLHTNLGRAPLATQALDAMAAIGCGYSNLEYDLAQGTRGSRHGHLRDLLCQLTGAEAALVTNNNAAAVMLALSALAGRREVIVSRGELIEIGGSFRIPDICELGNVTLREVGTTNRTHPRDYAEAIGPTTGALFKVHRSNFVVSGFVSEVDPEELVALGAQENIPVIWDLGSGCLVDLSPYGLPPEPTVRGAIASGVDLVTFSGDKLLGGPQAGILCGKAATIDKLRSHPFMRAVRPDKTTLAGLEATLRIYRDEDPFGSIPALAMLCAGVDDLEPVALALREQITAQVPELKPEVVRAHSPIGGGSMPEGLLETAVVRISGPVSARAMEEALRLGDPCIVARVAGDAVLLDVRTLLASQLDAVAVACGHAYHRAKP